MAKAALTPEPVSLKSFNPDAQLPYGLTVEHVRRAMEAYVEYLGL
jgi:hypothetical protein